MKIAYYLPVLAIFTLISCGDNGRPPLAEVKLVSDDYFGVKLDDPYRYMEDMDDTIFLNWMKQQSDYSHELVESLPGRDDLIKKMFEFDARTSDDIYRLHITKSGRYFYLKIRPEDEVGKLYYRNGYDEAEVFLYDPSAFHPEDGLNYVINYIEPDNDGEKVALTLSANGSESNTLILLDVSSKKLYPESISQVMNSVSWMNDGRGLLYGKTNSSDVHDHDRYRDTKIYVHILGERQDEDQVFFSSKMYPSVGMLDRELPHVYYDEDQDSFYLLLYTVERYLQVFEASAKNYTKGKQLDWNLLIDKGDQVQNFYVKGDQLYLYTAKGRSNFCLLEVDRNKPDLSEAKIVIPEPEDGILAGFYFTKKALYYKIKYNGVEERLYRKVLGSEETEEVNLPVKAGYLSVVSMGHKYSDIWITLTGWTQNKKRFSLDEDALTFSYEPLSTEAQYPEYADLQVEEILVKSHDGVEVPLSVIFRKNTKLNGTAPLLISGYGAYGKSRVPSFNPYMLMWTLKGGVFAVAHVRGGGELGDDWRLGGHKTTKPNTWKDMIACVEYLHGENYSSPEKTAMYSSSAGGVLVGRAMTERPDLFKVVMPLVALMNPLRIAESPNGPVNVPEFGTVNDSAECMALIEMDSYMNIEDGVEYPSVFITAGFNDPRVIVWQPAKFAARLQAATASKNPVLFDVDYTSGHGLGDRKSKSIEDLADIFTFAFWQIGQVEFQE